MPPTSQQIEDILGPVEVPHDNSQCNCHEGAGEQIDAYMSPACRALYDSDLRKRNRQVNALVLLVSEHRSRALREAADRAAGSLDFIALLGKKGWQLQSKLTSMVAGYLQDQADEQLLIKHCRWCGSTKHTSRTHDDAQF